MLTHKSFIMNYNSMQKVKKKVMPLKKSVVKEPKKESKVYVSHYDDNAPITLSLQQILRKTDIQTPDYYENYDEVRPANNASESQSYETDNNSYSVANAYFDAEQKSIEEFDVNKSQTLVHPEIVKEESAIDMAEKTKSRAASESTNQKQTNNNQADESNSVSQAEIIFDDEQETVDDKTFENDLRSIIEGKKEYDKLIKKTDPNENIPEQNLEDKMKNEHAIFDRIAQSMEMANSYDLGSITMDKKFDDFEAETDEDFTKRINDLLKEDKKVNGEEAPDYVKNKEEDDKILTKDFLNDIDKLNKLSSEKSEKKELVNPFSNDVSLTPENGGFFINVDGLIPGDIILSTTTGKETPAAINKTTKSDLSYAAIYIGDGILVEATESGIVEHNLENRLANDMVTVAFRHQSMDSEKEKEIENYFKNLNKEQSQFDQFAVIRNLSVQIINSYCATLSSGLKEKCRAFTGKIYLGTDSNNEFYCSHHLLKALESADLKLTNTQPEWKTPENLVQLNYNGTLRYIGHLKT